MKIEAEDKMPSGVFDICGSAGNRKGGFVCELVVWLSSGRYALYGRLLP